MDNQNNNKGIIALLIVIIVILSALCILFATGTISFNTNKVNDNDVNANLNDNNQDNEDNNVITLTVDEEKGLELYKFFVGNGTGPFKWENNEVVNYDEVISKMTDSYKKSFENDDNGFSIPLKENGEWKSYGGWGTDQASTFKDIKVVSKDSCKIHYEVTYEYTKMGDSEQKVYEDEDEFVVKTNSCNSNDLDVDFSKGYKMDSFKLIYGMKFE